MALDETEDGLLEQTLGAKLGVLLRLELRICLPHRILLADADVGIDG